MKSLEKMSKKAVWHDWLMQLPNYTLHLYFVIEVLIRSQIKLLRRKHDCLGLACL